MVKNFFSSSPENLDKFLVSQDSIWFTKLKNIDANIAYLTFKSDEILKVLKGILTIIKQNQLETSSEHEDIDDISPEQ